MKANETLPDPGSRMKIDSDLSRPQNSINGGTANNNQCINLS